MAMLFQGLQWGAQPSRPILPDNRSVHFRHLESASQPSEKESNEVVLSSTTLGLREEELCITHGLSPDSGKQQ